MENSRLTRRRIQNPPVWKEHETFIPGNNRPAFDTSALSRRHFLSLVPFFTLASQAPSLILPPAMQAQPASNQPPQDILRLQGMEPIRARTFGNAVVLKDGNLFLITDDDGTVPFEDEHGFGLYYQDCRLLNGYEMRLSGRPPLVLGSSAPTGVMAKFQFTNPPLIGVDGQTIARQKLAVQSLRMIEGDPPILYERLTVQNFSNKPVEFLLSLNFRSGFEDVQAIRGVPQDPGRVYGPVWAREVVHLLYEGRDGWYRSLAIHLDPPPDFTDAATAYFRIRLAPRALSTLHVSASPNISPYRAAPVVTNGGAQRFSQMMTELTEMPAAWLRSITRVQSSDVLLEKVLTRSLMDLRLLQTRIDNLVFYAAGTPWFTTLFGRDSLISALQTLAFDPVPAEETLRLLGKYQGQRHDDWRDEEPGKILHEIRIGELARLGVVPQPYYGTIDATPLFLILIARHAAWTGTLALFNDLHDAVEGALEWIARYEQSHPKGYVAYRSRSQLENHGWKDSGDAIVNEDGSLAIPPIALVEVQGYVYEAKRLIAELYARQGNTARAAQLTAEAARLQERFNRDFWIEKTGFFALALQGDGRPVTAITSNPGQALWSGIAHVDKARSTVTRMMADDMFSGWGIRTLSDREPAYDPLGYHVGTVWPHDNSLIAVGFRRYGCDQAAGKVFTALFNAALLFKDYRLPELFAGTRRDEYLRPVSYPSANPPQAWAAGAVPCMLESFLGFVTEAFERRLRIVRPMLPDFVDELEVHGLRVGTAEVNLRFTTGSNQKTDVEVLRVEGPLDVQVELA
ncbi:MAG TPA: glycogen debranching N-terminal domain-containing protein [Nitrospira sp.]|nr:glycogen debranching N-terminal domain-containing protein [Nitrospira sp.]